MTDSQNSTPRHLAGGRELKEEFVQADKDRDGRIDLLEFTSLMQGLDAGMSRTDLSIGFREIDTDADGLIDFQEFVDWWSAD